MRVTARSEDIAIYAKARIAVEENLRGFLAKDKALEERILLTVIAKAENMCD